LPRQQINHNDKRIAIQKVKLHEHSNHVAGREGTPKTGKTCEVYKKGNSVIVHVD
jgi:hypothetical protein